MEKLSKGLLFVDGLVLAFYIGVMFGKRTKRRKRSTPKLVKRGSSSRKSTQIEVNVATNLNTTK